MATAEAAKTEWTKLVRVYRADGGYDEVPMTKSMFNALRRMDEAERKRAARERKNWEGKEPKNFTDLKVDGNKLPRAKKDRTPGAGFEKPGRFEGERPYFPLLYGESQIWRGDGCHLDWRGRCAWCPEKLSESGYCLGCDKAGR